MKQKDKPTYNGLTFDSSGEMHFYWWCEELINAGYIESVLTQPLEFQLSGAIGERYIKPMKKVEDKVMEKIVMNPHIYTPDVQVKWTEKAENIFFIRFPQFRIGNNKELLNLIKADCDMISLIELKPIFDQNNMTRLAVINQKWVMDKFKVFVNIEIPEKLFDKTFTPQRYLMCDVSTAKKRKINYKNIISLNEFLTNNESKI
jgi:hypothetical protein